VQLVDSDEPSTPLLLLNGLNVPGDPQFLMPFDVAGDDSGSIYVADTGKRRVLRFDSDGAFVQRVDLAADGVTGLAVDPIALTANTQLVYILDAMLGEILVFELRSTLEDTQ
jgi:DNA-binding beta-propeller fold protein YncE